LCHEWRADAGRGYASRKISHCSVLNASRHVLRIESVNAAHPLGMKVGSEIRSSIPALAVNTALIRSLDLVVPEVWREIRQATGNGLEPSLPG
jgi:hypothetical protein